MHPNASSSIDTTIHNLPPYVRAMKVTRLIFLPPVWPVISALAAGTALAASGKTSSWMLEPATAKPSYAMVEPTSTNLNIDTVLLVYEQGHHGRFLQLQLYQTEEGVLAPLDAHAAAPKDEPRAEIAIDGQRFPLALVFSENFAVLGDDWDGLSPKLSDRLLRAMESGKTMIVRTDLLAEPEGPPAFDGEAVVNLQSHGKTEAFTAMRRCGETRQTTRR
jgi:hypothetical protein